MLRRFLSATLLLPIFLPTLVRAEARTALQVAIDFELGARAAPASDPRADDAPLRRATLEAEARRRDDRAALAAIQRDALERDLGLRPAAQALTTEAQSRIVGRVTDEDGQPIQDAFLSVIAGPYFFDSAFTNAEGRFEVDSLPVGTYTVRALAYGFRTELLGDVYCQPTGCDPATGASISLDGTAGSVGTADFVLDRGARIQGQVRDERTLVPLTDHRVGIRSESNFEIIETDAFGRFSLSGLSAGSYTAYAVDMEGYGGELFANLDCTGDCFSRSFFGEGTQIIVADREVKTGIDFGLKKYGEIRGTVRLAGSFEPLAYGLISFLRRQADGTFGFDSADALVVDGTYRSPGLEPGEYAVVVLDSPGRLGQLYPRLDCQTAETTIPLDSCPFSEAEVIRVDYDNVITAVDFELVRGAAFEGRVSDAATGAAIAGARLRVAAPSRYSIRHTTLAQGVTNESGRFSVSGLAAGDYTIFVDHEDYIAEIYPDIACTRCLFDDGRPVALAKDQTVAGLNFALDRPGEISSQIITRTNGLPIEQEMVVTLFDKNRLVPLYGLGLNGEFLLGGLVSGDYFLAVQSAGFRKKVYGLGDVDGEIDGTILARGLPIHVVAGQTTTLPAIDLAPAAVISGRFTAPHQGCTAALIDPVGRILSSISCRDDGSFEFRDLEAGTYFVSAGRHSETSYIWPNRACAGGFVYGEAPCDLPAGSAISIGAGQALTDLEITPPQTGDLALVIDQPDLPQFTETRIEIYDGARRLVGGQEWARAYGPLNLNGLAAGSYFVRISGPGVPPQLSPEKLCSPTNCPFDQAESIQVVAGARTTYSLRPRLAGSACRDGSNAFLCLNEDRFEVEATFRDPQGLTGTAQAFRQSDQAGLFWFFDAGNAELFVKVLNACAEPYRRFWVFATGLTDVEVELKVRDTLTGEVKVFRNPAGQAFQPIFDTAGFDSCAAQAGPQALEDANDQEPEDAMSEPASGHHGPPPPAFLCASSDEEACTGNGRFKISARYRTAGGLTGQAQVASSLGDSAAFTFFDRQNVELVVKVLDGCALNDRFWVYAAGMTDVEVEVEVLDLGSGKIWRGQSDLGRPFAPILDVQGLASCNVADPRDFF